VKTPTNDTQDFTVDLAPDWTTSMDVSITEIATSSLIKIIDINTTDTSNEETISNQYLAISFPITNSCIIANFTAYLRVLASGFVIPILYNASNAGGGVPEPDLNIHNGQLVSVNLPAHYAWYTFTFTAGNNFLDYSNTYNGYFFIVLVTVGVNVRWIVTLDSVSGDGGVPYTSVDGSSWSPYQFGGQDADFLSTVGLEPLTNTPTASGISMTINGTAVQDSGQWSRIFTVSEKATRFNVATTWPAVFNYRYNASLSNNVDGFPSFEVTEGGAADWNISASVSYPSITANANSRTLNFTLPDRWTVTGASKGGVPVTYTAQDGGSTAGWVFIDEPGGAGNSTSWLITASDANYIQNVVIYRNGVDVTGQEVNITDLLYVSSQLNTFTNGEGRFTPYDESGTSFGETTDTPSGTGLLNFTPFTPLALGIRNETMRCEVVWNNTYHVGVGVSSTSLVYPTTVADDLGPYTSLIGDNVNIRVYYEDTQNTAGIENAEVNVTFGLSTYGLSDIGGGYYQSALDTLAMNLGRGIHMGAVSADRSGYDAAFTTVFLTLWSKTQLVSNWTAPVIISYTETVILEVNYSVFTPLGEGGIEDAQVNITGPSFYSDLTQSSGGNYSVLLDGTVLDVGTHILVVNASKPGNYLQNNTLVVTLIVQGEATNISGTSPSTVNGGDNFNVTVTYRKDSDGTGITGAGVTCLLNDSAFTAFIVFDLNNGTYKVQFQLNINSSSSVFNITLTVSRSGYDPASHPTLIDVLIRPANINVVIQSTSPLIYDNAFTLLVTYTDMSAQGLVDAWVEGNWTTINTIDNGDGTYTVRCITTGASVGYWTISFNISVENYESEFFIRSFHLVWPTSLTPENNDYTPSEYQNETLILEVTFTNTELGSGIGSATVWAVFQSTTYPLVPVGGGVYRLILDLTGVSPATYNLDVYAQRTNHENQTINLNLAVLAKLNPTLTVYIPPNISPAQEIPITLTLTFPNGTAIVGLNIDVVVWMHHTNGTDVTLLSDTVTTDTLGMRIVIIQLPSYPEDIWGNGNNAPEVWANATYLGSRELAYTTVSTFSALTPPSPLPWWVELLLMLLPFIVIIVIIAVIGRILYVKRVRPKRLAKQMAVEQTGGLWAQRIMGLMDLRALFVMYAQTGLPVFTYNFTGGEMPSALLSGFISAVNSFYGELSGELDRETQLRDIHYKDLHLSLREGQHVVSVLILDSSPSQEMTESLARFATQFETQFASDLSSFDGRIDIFEPARIIVEDCFHSELLLSYECVHAPSRGFARKVYDLAVKTANTEGRIFLPQLFIASVEKFGPDKKFAVANALELLHAEGCLAPAKKGSSTGLESLHEALNSASEE
jgi:hypothetical protein